MLCEIKYYQFILLNNKNAYEKNISYHRDYHFNINRIISNLLYKICCITKKQKYDNCVKTCEELMIKESSKQYCGPECEKITGYNPLEQEKQSINTKIKKNAEYCCEWSWPQKVIIRDTKKVIQPCTYDRPWCDKADGLFESVGCCKNKNHTDCLKTKDYLNTNK